MSAPTEEVTYSVAFARGVAEEMARNKDIFIIGTDLVDHGGHWGQARGLADAVGKGRVFDAPISEAAMVATGVGAALAGMHPIVDLNFIDFTFGAMDEIVNQAAKIEYMMQHPVPLTIRATAGAAHGGPQHNNGFEAWFMHVPGLSVAYPSSPYDAKGLIKTALRMQSPVMFFMHKRLTALRGPIGGEDDLVEFGKARVCRAGEAITLVTYGAAVQKAMQAADRLAEEQVGVEVIDLRTLSPLDLESLYESARKTHRVVVLDEAPKVAGPAAEIAASIQEAVFSELHAPVTRVSALDLPVGESPTLLERAMPSIDDVVAALHKVSGR